MTMKSLLGAMAVAMLMLNAGCSEGTAPFAPSRSAMNELGGASGSAALETSSYPAVTLEPDLTANPAWISVWVGGKVLITNNSGRTVQIRSYNCSQFSSLWLEPGVSRHTMPFYTAGKTCDYFVWDYPQKILQGQVAVQ